MSSPCSYGPDNKQHKGSLFLTSKKHKWLLSFISIMYIHGYPWISICHWCPCIYRDKHRYTWSKSTKSSDFSRREQTVVIYVPLYMAMKLSGLRQNDITDYFSLTSKRHKWLFLPYFAHVYSCISMDTHRPCVSVDINRYRKTFLYTAAIDIHTYPWIPMNRGYPCIYTKVEVKKMY